MSLLSVSGVQTSFGRTRVHRDLSLAVHEGEIVALLGHNGAGKTVALRAIAGLKNVDAGTVVMNGREITNWPAEQVVRVGISLVPQGRRIFTSLTVHDNLVLGGYARRDQAAVEVDIQRMFDYFPVLAERRAKRGGELSGGQQQMLAIARGLIARPKVLLLDEPSLGLSPKLVTELRDIILGVHEQFGASILLVEQHVSLALAVAERGYLMKTGEMVASGVLSELRDSGAMQEIYLGRG